jgi:hypothetical protein
MAPSLADARNGDSIYFTGTTTVNSKPVEGWDFNDIWTIVQGLNNGYPILLSSVCTVKGTVTDGTVPIKGAVVLYNGTSTTTDSEGKYTITAEYGSTVTITAVTKSGYIVNGDMPSPFTMAEDHVQDFMMTAEIMLSVSQRKIGNMAIVEGTADISSGASWASIFVQFSDGSFHRNVSPLVYIGSTAQFYAEFSASAQPVSYLVFISDAKPEFGGSYTPPAMKSGGF